MGPLLVSFVSQLARVNQPADVIWKAKLSVASNDS